VWYTQGGRVGYVHQVVYTPRVVGWCTRLYTTQGSRKVYQAIHHPGMGGMHPIHHPGMGGMHPIHHPGYGRYTLLYTQGMVGTPCYTPGMGEEGTTRRIVLLNQ